MSITQGVRAHYSSHWLMINRTKYLTIILIELQFANVGSRGEGKTGVPRGKLLGARTRTDNKLSPHMTSSPGIEPEPYW